MCPKRDRREQGLMILDGIIDGQTKSDGLTDWNNSKVNAGHLCFVGGYKIQEHHKRLPMLNCYNRKVFCMPMPTVQCSQYLWLFFLRKPNELKITAGKGSCKKKVCIVFFLNTRVENLLLVLLFPIHIKRIFRLSRQFGSEKVRFTHTFDTEILIFIRSQKI